MQYSEIKKVKSALEDMGCYNFREFIKTIEGEGKESSILDFEIGEFRFIHESIIDNIMDEELSSDEYVLGCFNASFLTYYMDLEEHDITHIQEKCPEALGKLIIATGQLENVRSGYVSADGYGHHFAHYDHEEHDLPNGYYGFRVN